MAWTPPRFMTDRRRWTEMTNCVAITAIDTEVQMIRYWRTNGIYVCCVGAIHPSGFTKTVADSLRDILLAITVYQTNSQLQSAVRTQLI